LWIRIRIRLDPDWHQTESQIGIRIGMMPIHNTDFMFLGHNFSKVSTVFLEKGNCGQNSFSRALWEHKF
jgi:hypothetical protein